MFDLPLALTDACRAMKKLAQLSGAVSLAFALMFSLSGCGSYNRLVTLEQNVNKKWADVQSVYQRRADLIPNLVNTVQGAANFEKSTLTEVTNARASACANSIVRSSSMKRQFSSHRGAHPS